MNHLQHVGISVVDLERSVAWYTKHFGFQKVRQFEKEEFKIRGATMQLEASQLEILQPHSPAVQAGLENTIAHQLSRIGTNHIAISVSDVSLTYEQFRNEGVDLVGDIVGGRFFFCKDPDGTLIEVRQ